MYYSHLMNIERGFTLLTNTSSLLAELSTEAELIVIARELYCMLESALGSEIKSCSPEAAISLWRSNIRGHRQRLLAHGQSEDEVSIILEDNSRMADMLERVLLELRALSRQGPAHFDDISADQERHGNLAYPIALL